MIVYLITILLSIFIARHAETKAGVDRAIWLLIAFFPLVLIAGLRASSVGVDTDYYPLPFFSYSLEMNLPDMMATAGCEPGFSSLIWILSRLTRSFNSVLLIVQLLMVLPIVWISHKLRVRHLQVVVLTYACLIFPWSLNLMRQALACSTLIFAYYYAQNRNLVRYALCVLLSVSIHNTGFLGLVFYPICLIARMEEGKRERMALGFIVMATAITVMVVAFPELIVKPILHLKESYARFESDLYSGSFNAALTSFPIAVSACGFLLSRRNESSKNDSWIFSLSLIMAFAGVLAPLSILNQTLSRLSEMYLIFSCFAIPGIVQIDRRAGLLLTAFSVAIFFWVYCYGNASGALPYYFFWE